MTNPDGGNGIGPVHRAKAHITNVTPSSNTWTQSVTSKTITLTGTNFVDHRKHYADGQGQRLDHGVKRR